MNKQQKDELKKIIVEELENYYYKVNINSEEFANIVISKIPDTIITEDSIVEVLRDKRYSLKYPDSKGHIARLIGYKSFRGMVYQFKRINKNCIKNNWSADFTIRLPLKWK